MSTFGPAYVKELDKVRIDSQMRRVYDAMIEGDWHSLAELAYLTNDPESSISAQMRHLRKPRFGGWIVEKRRRTVGTWEYRLLAPVEEGENLPLPLGVDNAPEILL